MQGINLSREHLNDNIEKAIVAAYRNLHDLGVIHGDIRPENLLVLDDESVCIVDFDMAYVLCEDDEGSAEPEDIEVVEMLRKLKIGRGWEQNGHSSKS